MKPRSDLLRLFLVSVPLLSIASFAQVQIGLKLGSLAGDQGALVSGALTLFLWILFYFLYDIWVTGLLQNQIERYFHGKRTAYMRNALSDTSLLSGNPSELWVTISHTLIHLNDEIAHRWIWIGKRLITALGAVIACALLSPRLTLYYLLILPLLIIGMQIVSRHSQKLQKRILTEKSALAAWSSDTCRGMETIKAYQMEPLLLGQLGQINRSIYLASLRSDRQRLFLTLLKYAGSMISLLLLLLVAGHEPVSVIVSFTALTGYLQAGLDLLDSIFYSYRICHADWEKIHENLV